MSSAVDAMGNPIPSSAVLTASAKHIGMRCMPKNVALLKCKKNDPNPEKCLKKGRDVTRCVLGLEFPREMNVFLKDIVPAAQNNINTRFIILDKARLPAANDKNCIALAADETAAVHIQLWGDECDAFEAGDIVKLSNGIFSFVRNSGLVLRAGKRGKMEKMGEFAIAFVETPNVSKIQWNPAPENPKRYIQNAVISAYSRIFPPLS